MNRNLLRIAVFADKSFSETTVPVIVYNDRPRVRYPGIFSNTLTFPVTGDGTFVNPGGTVNGASFGSQTLTAGSIASLFGTGLASMQAVAESLPVSTTLGGVTVRLNGIPAPVFFISPLQINFQIPWELEGQPQATVTVTADGFTGAATVNLAGTSPRIFAINQQGSGQGAILIVGTGEVAAPPASIPERTTRPVKRGEFISIYCTGLGPVNNQPATGTAALSNPLSTTATAPVVTVGGVLAAVSFSGLAPGFVGLYQVDVQVPESTPMGTRYRRPQRKRYGLEYRHCRGPIRSPIPRRGEPRTRLGSILDANELAVRAAADTPPMGAWRPGPGCKCSYGWRSPWSSTSAPVGRTVGYGGRTRPLRPWLPPNRTSGPRSTQRQDFRLLTKPFDGRRFDKPRRTG